MPQNIGTPQATRPQTTMRFIARTDISHMCGILGLQKAVYSVSFDRLFQ